MVGGFHFRRPRVRGIILGVARWRGDLPMRARLLAFPLCLLLLASARAEEPAGRRVFVCGHSFHVFVAAPLARLAKSAGIKGHTNAGVQMLGGSRVIAHWKLEDKRNKVKPALKSGKVDVLTVSPHLQMPDEGIDHLTELGLKHNPKFRILVQQSWYPFDVPGKGRVTKNEQRDKKTVAELRPHLEKWTKEMQKQIKAINDKHKKTVAYQVPVGDAVLALRGKVIEGKAPGIKKQSELFTDPIGHAKAPIVALAAYCHYAVIYGRSPVGLKGLVKADEEESAKLHKLLQEIAWQAVTKCPYSGVKAEKK